MKTQSLYLVIILLLSCHVTQSIAQLRNPNFRHLTTSQGLSNNTVFSITQDDIGFVWLGSKSGLNRFDGYQFENFPLPDAAGEISKNNTVFSLLKDHKNLIWVGQKDAGLVIYNPHRSEFTRYLNHDNPTVNWNTITVRALYEDSRAWLWVGTSGNGVIVLDEKRKVIKRICDCNESSGTLRLSHNFVFDFEEDQFGNVYIATAGKGLNKYDVQSDEIKHIHASDTEDMNSFSKTLCLDSSNTLWVGTEGSGLYSMKDEKWAIYRKSNSKISSDIIKDLEQDANGQLWIATDGGGLNEYITASQSFLHYKYDYRQSNSLNTDALYNLYFDTSDNLWIGTFNGGINVLNAIQTPFITNRNHYEEKKLDLRSVLSVQEDMDGTVWLGTDGGGIFYFENYADSIVLHSAIDLVTQGQMDEVVTCMQPSLNGGFWYGTFAKGLNFFNTKTGKITKYEQDEDDIKSLINNNVWDLALDKRGGLWIATLGNGLDYLPKGKTSFIHHGDFSGQLSDVQIMDLHLQKNNRYLWVATESKGLNRIDLKTNEVRQFNHNGQNNSSLSSNNIYAVDEDSEGRLWVITDVAVDLFNPIEDNFSTLKLDDAFQNEAINSLQSDKEGFIWFTTASGIFRFDPTTSKVTAFGKDPGIQNTIYNPKASLLTKRGEIILGGVNGFSVITPDEVKPNEKLPTPVLSDMKIEGQSVRSGKYKDQTIHTQNLNHDDLEIYLSYKNRDISFVIGSTDFTNPLQIKYAYKLEGYDDNWIYVDAYQKTIKYTSLEGGEYSLLLKAANSSGVWNNKIKKVSINVEPPFWKKTWFVILSILCLAGAILLVYRFLLNRQREMFELKALEQEQAIMKQEQKILQLNNQNLEQEVSNKKAELNASILEMAHKNEFLTVLKSKIKKIQASADSSAKRPLQSIVNIIDSEQRQEDYWDKFQHIFNQTFQDFIDQVALKHPNLTQNDYRITCFIRMKLTNKEIASILNITHNGVEQAKYRLKKKMELDKKENLNSYIQQFGDDLTA